MLETNMTNWIARVQDFKRVAFIGALILALAGCASTSTSTSTGEYVDDTVLTTKVKAALTNEFGTDGLTDMQVETYKGTVQISGFVDSAAIRARAGNIAAGINGVSRVDNRLAVK